MIARIWHGVTPAAMADEYTDYLKKTGLTDYRSTPGNQAVYLLRRIEGEQAHFLTLTFWESEEAIRRFAGEEIDKARYYPEDARFLLEMEARVQHYELIGESEDRS